MTAPQGIYVALVALSALWVVVHVALVTRTFRAGARGGPHIAGLLFPPTAPVVAVRHGERAVVVAWVVLLAAYLALLSYGAP